MRTKSEILQEYFGVKTSEEARRLYDHDDDKDELNGSNWTSLQLPYRAPDCADLPSMDEIRSAMETNQVKLGLNRYRVCTLGRFVVKWGSQVVIQGAEDLLYIKANSQARVPMVYAAFIKEEMYKGRLCSVNYVVMERINGENLEWLWDEVSDEARSIITSRIFEQIRHLRAMPSPGYYGRVHNLPLDPRSPMVCVRQDERCGPYESYAEFCKAALVAAEIRAAQYPGGTDEEYSPKVQRLLVEYGDRLKEWEGRGPTYTHLDPGFYNVLVRQTKSEQGAEDWEVTYIDFEYCGWYPPWVQAMAFLQSLGADGETMGMPEPIVNFLDMHSKAYEESFEEQVGLFYELQRKIGFQVM
jgi:hypothetical protein